MSSTNNHFGHRSSNTESIVHNWRFALQECHDQNTAREYIKSYTTAAQSVESFGEIPEWVTHTTELSVFIVFVCKNTHSYCVSTSTRIIPIYLVHRPSNDIPYATLEEELIGDFVKYSVKDGKEINLMRRDSEAGQKCCAFQHWVYHKTEGNLLVTDMQGREKFIMFLPVNYCALNYNLAYLYQSDFCGFQEWEWGSLM